MLDYSRRSQDNRARVLLVPVAGTALDDLVEARVLDF